ncbi:MAG: hypothetical protein D3908_00630, partial [Candidatus Electrothrix sp. AUS4]|nr:hypothetical protein [Candidatus Electrothrix sp. AUS4]
MVKKRSCLSRAALLRASILVFMIPALGGAESLDESHPVDRAHSLITEGLLTSARRLDSFFGDEDFLDDDERTRMRIRLKSTVEEGESVNFRTYCRLRLAMPQLHERVKLFFDTSSIEDLSSEESSLHHVDDTGSDEEDRSLYADLRYYAARLDDLNIRFSSGLHFSELLPHGYFGLRYRQNWELERYQLRFTQNFRWYDNRGWESKTGFDLEREVFADKLLRLTLDGNWNEHTLGYPHTFTFSLFQPLSRDQALEYSISNSFRTRPAHDLTETLCQVRYRYRFWREWLG